MKAIMKVAGLGIGLMMTAVTVFSQKLDQERMERDIEVAENVLATLLRQQTTGRGSFYFNEVNGNYMPGYGVMFSIPYSEFSMNAAVVLENRSDNGYSIVWDSEGRSRVTRVTGDDKGDKRMKTSDEKSIDSLKAVTKEKYIEAMKVFLADYGDMISQLGSDERIMVTNRPSGFTNFNFGMRSKRSLLSAEVSKVDLVQFKQGKLTRDQLMKKITVTNTESTDEVETDLELFSSILNRLYRSDLSKTYFSEGNMYYERLKDYGAVYYMQVYSSNRDEGDTHSMPTVGLRRVSETERNKKVVELYPKFEKELKENILEYGRTIKSLKPDELLVVNVKLTKCESCGIPNTLEASVKNAVLSDYGSGKITKEAAAAKINIKKGPNQ
jgi:hypothetical protein